MTPEEEAGTKAMMNELPLRLALEEGGHHFVEIARSEFLSRSKHEDTPPVEYATSFEVEQAEKDGVAAVTVANTDRTAEWVEFGSHAGGKTPVLKYRIFGLTADALEAEGEV